MIRSAPLMRYAACVVLLASACRKSDGPPRSDDVPPAQATAHADSTQPPPTRVDIDVPIDDPDRWLYAEEATEPEKGGWVSGSFDPEKNKLSIRTKDVKRFAVDMSRVRIDWKKLVILSIDGRNSELRRRDFDLYHFQQTPYGEWIVVEP